jgi:6,7-dimethyl-8-ribityllumazine synthase
VSDRFEDTQGWPYREVSAFSPEREPDAGREPDADPELEAEAEPAVEPRMDPELAREEQDDDLDSVPAAAVVGRPEEAPEPPPEAAAPEPPFGLDREREGGPLGADTAPAPYAEGDPTREHETSPPYGVEHGPADAAEAGELPSEAGGEPSEPLPDEAEPVEALAVQQQPLLVPAPAPEQEPAVVEQEPAGVDEEPADVEHLAGGIEIPAGYDVLEGEPTGERRTAAVVVSRFNGEITNDLLGSALAELEDAGVARNAVIVVLVPGAFELPLAALALAKTRRYSCVIALGCVIRGETPHFDFVASEAASGLQLAAIETGVPVSFGVLTTETEEQARARVGKGAEAVRAALEMADLFAELRAHVVASR